MFSLPWLLQNQNSENIHRLFLDKERSERGRKKDCKTFYLEQKVEKIRGYKKEIEKTVGEVGGKPECGLVKKCFNKVGTLNCDTKTVKSLSRVRLFATPWTVAYQASPSMGFSRQEYWSIFPRPGEHSQAQY